MVAEERKGKAELLDHGAIADHSIEPDTDDLRASLSELSILHGIAHELPSAVGSPVATVKHQNDPTSAERRAEAPGLSLLIGYSKYENRSVPLS